MYSRRRRGNGKAQSGWRERLGEQMRGDVDEIDRCLRRVVSVEREGGERRPREGRSVPLRP